MSTAPRLYRIREFAERAGVSVRTLHHYDRLGLLKPSGHTTAGYRLYGDRDFARLQQIVTLKFIGLSLAQIKDLLAGRTFDLAGTLRLQREMLQEKRRQLDLALVAIERADAAAAVDGLPDWEALRKIVEVIEMQSKTDWTKKYYSPEAQAKIAERASANPRLAEQGQRDWAVLLADIDEALREAVDPSSVRAQALAARWNSLVQGFTAGNPEVAAGLKRLYADESNWPATFKKPFSTEACNFIAQSNAKLKS